MILRPVDPIGGILKHEVNDSDNSATGAELDQDANPTLHDDY